MAAGTLTLLQVVQRTLEDIANFEFTVVPRAVYFAFQVHYPAFQVQSIIVQ